MHTTPTIALIAALSKNHVIGIANKLPWRLPADLKHFKQLTLGKPIIMGRKTYESIGKPLPDRVNLILTRDTNITAPGCIIRHTVEEALTAVQPANEIMVIGGSLIYQTFFPMANRLYLTIIEAEIEGDAYFPEWNANEWREISRESHESDQNNPYNYSFIQLNRIK